MSSENDPRYSILVGGFGVGDAYFDNGGVLPAEGGIAPFAVTSTGQLTTYSAIDQAAVEATVTYPGAEHSAQIWGVTLMGAIVTESTIGGQTYTEVSHQPLNLSSGGLLLTSAAFAGSTGSAVPTTAAFIAGTDGTDLRALLTDSSGQLKVLVENFPSGSTTAGTPGSSPPAEVDMMGAVRDDDGNVIGVLASSSGALIIDTDGAALNTVFANAFGLGSGQPSDAALAGATDGTDTYPLLVDASGYLKVNVAAGGGGGGAVWGPNASGAAPSEDPVLNAGWDGTDVRTLLTDTSGQLKILVENSPTVSISGSSIQAIGSAIPADVVMVGASDGTDSRAMVVDASGYLKVNVAAGGAGGGAVYGPTAVGSAPANPPELVGGIDGAGTPKIRTLGIAVTGAAVPANGVLVGGSDGTDLQALLTDTTGRLYIQQPDQILVATVAVTPAASAVTKTATATVNGQSVAVTIANTDTGQYSANVSVKVVNTTTGQHAHWQSCGLVWAGSDVTLLFNLGVAIGDSLTVSITAPSTQTANKTNVTAIVLPSPAAVILRPDGRGMPLASQHYDSNPGASTFLSAPPTGFRILASSISMSTLTTTTGTPNLGATINGASVVIAITSGAGGQVAYSFPEGILLDPATGLTGSLGGGSGGAYDILYYDVVPV